jgi:ABC-2 type transport system ATP-binding protein
VLELRGVSKSWNGRPVLHELDLSLLPGTTTWLGGRNGAGKTTLLRIAAGLICPERGSVRLAGLDAEADRRGYQSRLGYAPAGNGALYARLSVRDNLDFWAGMALLGRAERSAAVETALARFELGPLTRQRADRLSMGQRQRVRLAAAFLHEPELVLLDEPQTSLDPDALELLARALDDLRARGGSALWCAPRPEEGIEFDRLLELDEGRLCERTAVPA